MNENPLRLVLQELFDAITVLNGLIFILSSQFKHHKNLFQDLQERESEIPRKAGAAAALIICDLTEWPESGWRNQYPVGKYEAMDEAYFEVSELLARRECGWTVARAFEAFETFLYDLIANVSAQDDSGTFTETLKEYGKPIQPSDSSPINWRDAIRRKFRPKKNQEMLDLLGTWFPSFQEAETRNNQDTDLRAWFDAVSEVRHASVHANGLIKDRRYLRLSSQAQNALLKHFPGETSDLGFELGIDKKATMEALKRFAEYGFLIFKCSSQGIGMEWDYLRSWINPDNP